MRVLSPYENLPGRIQIQRSLRCPQCKCFVSAKDTKCSNCGNEFKFNPAVTDAELAIDDMLEGK